MDFCISYHNCTTKDEAYESIKTHITPEVLEKYKVSPSFEYDETNKVISAKGSGFSFSIQFQENEAHGTLELSFLLKPLKGKVMESLERQLRKYL
ncbi:MAG: polyhydroxyalkanoic acid system family protein [Halobacteriovoraceae bacterium]|nr:polyhydroxyalkanoic acid system family protein [Halobacteriovoraceae bacterium]